MLAKFQAIAVISTIDCHKPSRIPQNAELHSTCHFFVKISAKLDRMNTRFGPIDMSRLADSYIIALLLATFSTVISSAHTE